MSIGITGFSGMQAADIAAHGGSRSQPQTPAATPAQGITAAAAQLTPNPSLRIDSALAMVVIEFHGTDGAIENSIPTAQQLDAYRRSQGADRATAPAPTTPAPTPPAAAAGEQPAAESNRAEAPSILA